jgi:hypothetical protein
MQSNAEKSLFPLLGFVDNDFIGLGNELYKFVDPQQGLFPFRLPTS